MTLYAPNFLLNNWGRCSKSKACIYKITGDSIRTDRFSYVESYNLKCIHCGMTRIIAKRYNEHLYSIEEAFSQISILVTLKQTI